PYQYLSKGGGGYTLIDCNYVDNYGKLPVVFGFSDVTAPNYRAYVSNVTRNGQPLTVRDLKCENPAIDITGTELLENFKLVDAEGNVIYNIYNLMKGSDGWDPLDQKDVVEALHPEKYVSRSLLTTKIAPASIRMYDEGASSTITPSGATSYTYSVSKEAEEFVTLTPSEDTTKCVVTLKDSMTTEAKTVVVDIRTEDGRGSAVTLTVEPKIRTAPTLDKTAVVQNANGTATVSYEVISEEKLPDDTRIQWEVADDAEGTNAIPLTPDRAGLKTVTLHPGCIGKYLIVTLTPKQTVSEAGEKVKLVLDHPIDEKGLEATKHLTSDFRDIPLNNHELKGGFWTAQGYQPEDTKENYIPLDGEEVSTKYSATYKNNYGAVSVNDNSWSFGTGGKNGFLNYTGVYHTKRGARLMYTPYGDTFGDMDVTLKMAPGKTASQGFGSDKNYMDIYLKYDFTTNTGYSLRIYRNSGNSCCFVLMEHKDGLTKEICEPVESAAFITECTAHVWTEEGTKLKAEVTTTANIDYAPVSISAEIAGNKNGSFGVLTTSSAGDNTTYLIGLSIDWK
ncbi:MAG: hypothetical protein KBS81_11540, partial [Spirochaetales bacterium]|nr:hypothetical protein [Candidatus Physcosoma equi]